MKKRTKHKRFHMKRLCLMPSRLYSALQEIQIVVGNLCTKVSKLCACFFPVKLCSRRKFLFLLPSSITGVEKFVNPYKNRTLQGV